MTIRGHRKKEVQNAVSDFDMNLDELNDLFDSDLDDDESGAGNKKKEKKSKAPWVISLVAIAAIGGIFAKGLINSEPPPPPEPKAPENIQVELVNLQQVAWADNICQAITQYNTNDYLLRPSGKPTNPLKLRSIITSNIEKNRQRLTEITRTIEGIPEKSLGQAHQMAGDTTPADNNLKVSDGVDEKVGAMNRAIVSSYQGYNSALDKVAGDLNKVADYNFNGMRDGIEQARNQLGDLSNQLFGELSTVFNDESFDNLATMEAVSELESCNGSVINGEQLKKERGKDLDFMHRVRDITIKKRCEQFMESTQQSTDEKVEQWRQTCQEELSSIVINDTDPLTKSKLDMQEDARIIPKVPEQEDESGTSQSPSASPSEESKSSDDKGSSSSSSETSSSSTKSHSSKKSSEKTSSTKSSPDVPPAPKLG